MKRVLSLILAIALLFALGIPALAEEAGLANFKRQAEYTGFSDVPGAAWYADSVKTVCEYGLMNGKGQGKFMPTGNLSVAETLAIACRLHSIFQGGDGEIGQSTPWYQSYIDYAAEYGIISFPSASPSFWNERIQRSLFSRILSRSIPASALPAINDIPVGTIIDVDFDENTEAVYQLFNAGILTGSNGWFLPSATISRAEAAAIISRIILPDMRIESNAAASPINTFVDGISLVHYQAANGAIRLIDGNSAIVVSAYAAKPLSASGLRWESSDPSIAAVSALTGDPDLPSNCSLALICGVSSGTALISITNAEGVKTSFSVEVSMTAEQAGTPTAAEGNGTGQGAAQELQQDDAAESGAKHYILNTNSKVFHHTWCVSVRRMSEQNKKDFYGTRSEAISRGYRSCHNCNS